MLPDQTRRNNWPTAEMRWANYFGLRLRLPGFQMMISGISSSIKEQQPPIWRVHCDANDDGNFNAIVDGLYILTFGFVDGPPPPPPHPLCGSDPTPDGVGCDDFTGCP